MIEDPYVPQLVHQKMVKELHGSIYILKLGLQLMAVP